MGRAPHIPCPLSHPFRCICTPWGYVGCNLRKRRWSTRLLQRHGLCGWDQNSGTFPHILPTLLFLCSAVAILSFSLRIKRHSTYKTYTTDCSLSQRVLFAHQIQPWLQRSAWCQELAASRDSPTSQAEVVLRPKFTATAECVGMATC